MLQYNDSRIYYFCANLSSSPCSCFLVRTVLYCRSTGVAVGCSIHSRSTGVAVGVAAGNLVCRYWPHARSPICAPQPRPLRADVVGGVHFVRAALAASRKTAGGFSRRFHLDRVRLRLLAGAPRRLCQINVLGGKLPSGPLMTSFIARDRSAAFCRESFLVARRQSSPHISL